MKARNGTGNRSEKFQKVRESSKNKKKGGKGTLFTTKVLMKLLFLFCRYILSL
jgi:hypothetical protein